MFRRVGDGHSYSYAKANPYVKSGALKRERVGTKFQKVKSNVWIPLEMVTGSSAKTWLQGERRLKPRIEHEIKLLSKGIVK